MEMAMAELGIEQQVAAALDVAGRDAGREQPRP